MSARHTRLLALAAAALIALSACGSNGAPPTDPPATDQTTSTDAASDPTTAPAPAPSASAAKVGVPVPDGTIEAKPDPKPRPPLGGGANAAPDANTIVNSYDSRPEAATTFKGWWMFELQTANDVGKDFQKVYWDGIFVCMSRARGAGPEPILTVLDRDLGYDPSGAAGVYAAALRALCMQFNFGWDPNVVDSFGGYNTFYDEEIKRAHSQIVAKAPGQGLTLNGPLSLFSVGLLAKYTCHYLNSTNSTVGLRQYLEQHSRFVDLANPVNPPAFIHLAVTESVFRICLDHHHKFNFSWY